MSALLFLKRKREISERMDFAQAVRMAVNGRPDDYKRVMDQWARAIEIYLRWDD